MTPRQQILVVVVILAIVGGVDFFKRVHVPRQPATRAMDAGDQGQFEPPMPLAMARQRLQSWFPAQAAQGQTGAADAGSRDPSAPIPDRAAIGGWQFVLRGVFDAGPPFAVFDVVPRNGGSAEQHRLSVGEEVKGVRVEQIAGRRVSLSSGEEVVQLALFIDPRDSVTAVDEQYEQ